jgi:mannose-6-phosphate isomerase-like protein (cupin superfamily)
MRLALFTALTAGLVGALGTAPVSVQAPPRGDGGVRILQQAPTDRSVNVPGETLTRYLKEMDAHKLATLRMVEGGKYNVNIRRIRNAETALIHPKTIDTWVVLDGGGTMTTGGRIEQGRIVGGVSTPLKVGDVYFVPAGVPHGVSGVNGSVTWLNVRWDVDWADGATMGAGTLTPPPAAPGRPSFKPLEYAPADRAVYIPKEKLTGYLAQMEADKSAVLRMIEGGHFNVNIRRVKAPSAEHHPVTADAWVLIEGGGMVATGFDRKGNQPVPGTGVSAFARVGDLFYVPANLTHGFTAVDSVAAWLNIRWDTNWPAAGR